MDKKIDPSIRRRATRRRLLRAGVAVAAAAGAIIAIAGSLEGGVKRSDLQLATADRGELETTVVAQGRIVPAHEEIVNSPVSTQVLRVYAQPGDSVKAGMPLLLLDLESQEAEYSKALDSHRVACQELERERLASKTLLSELSTQIEVKEMEVSRLAIEVDNERRLDSLGSGTGDRVRQAETAYATGKLQLRQLREKLANERAATRAAEEVQSLRVSSSARDLEMMASTLRRASIPAPRDGVVTYLVSDIGTQLAAGTKVAVVADLSRFRLTGEVPEGSSDRVAVGSRVTARVGGAEFGGTIVNVTPQAKGGVIDIAASLDDPGNPRLKSGLRAELYISYGYRDNVARIPAGNYFSGPGDYELFVANSDGTRLEKRRVKLGGSNRNYVEVVSGIAPGEQVAIGDMEQWRKHKKLKIKD